MTTNRVSLMLVLSGSVIFTTSCFEKVDDGASTRAEGWDGVSTDQLQPGDREVFGDVDETMDLGSGCAKTAQDAEEIRRTYCSGCHNQGQQSMGVPVFDFVMDDDQLKTAVWTRDSEMLRFLTPGDPENSQIYVRTMILRDMPKGGTDLGQDTLPLVTYSEGSVLFEWIKNCMGSDPLASGN